jgi:hypothetical protein
VRDDPFASLSGLDQQLFREPKQANKETSKLVSKQASGDADPQVSGTAGLEPSGPAEQASSGVAAQQAALPATRPAEQRSRKPAVPQASRTPVSQSSGHADPVRVDGRHTYDIFQDQVRWMNRIKLDFEDTYESRITINGIVKLALDVLREDYEVNGEDSNLVRVLVNADVIEIEGITPAPRKESA